MKLSQYVPALAPSSHPTPVIGGRAVGRVVREMIGSAQHAIDMSAFRMSLPSTLDALAAAHARGVHVNLLADSQNLDAATTPQTTRTGISSSADDFREYGADPYKQHSKSIGRDRTEAMIASDVSDIGSETRMEFGVRFDGEAARIFDDLHHIDATTPDAIAKPIFQAAREAGILVNDPQHGVRDVSAGVKSLIDNSKRTLLVVTKALESKDMVSRIVDAAQRGVRTLVVTNDLHKDLRERLLGAGVQVKNMHWGSSMKEPLNVHGTTVATNGVAMVTSLPLVARAIKGSKGRQSRELGVTIDGIAGRRMMDRLRAAYRDVPDVHAGDA